MAYRKTMGRNTIPVMPWGLSTCLRAGGGDPNNVVRGSASVRQTSDLLVQPPVGCQDALWLPSCPRGVDHQRRAVVTDGFRERWRTRLGLGQVACTWLQREVAPPVCSGHLPHGVCVARVRQKDLAIGILLQVGRRTGPSAKRAQGAMLKSQAAKPSQMAGRVQARAADGKNGVGCENEVSRTAGQRTLTA